MLVLSRKVGEKIVLADGLIVVSVARIQGGTVRIGIEAPADIPIVREEVVERLREKGEGVVKERGRGRVCVP